jgi:hypothetical protein
MKPEENDRIMEAAKKARARAERLIRDCSGLREQGNALLATTRKNLARRRDIAEMMMRKVKPVR